MNDDHRKSLRAAAQERRALTPEIDGAFRAFSQLAFEEGALSAKTKQLIAVAVAHVTQCPDCIRAHARGASRAGASKKEIMEAIWIAAEMRSGAAVAHSRLALSELADPSRPNVPDG